MNENSIKLFKHCELCKNKSQNLEIGVFCSLTNKNPNFDAFCDEISFNENLEIKITEVNIAFEKTKREKRQGDKTKIQMLKDVKVELNSRIIKRLRNEFDNRMVVIDEVHNIRKTDENENKKVAINLEFLIKSALNSF